MLSSHRVSLLLAWALATGLGLGGACAQEFATKIWDIKLGTPIADLPLDQFVDPACGTNGGPPSRVLKSFSDFALCPLDKTTGPTSHEEVSWVRRLLVIDKAGHSGTLDPGVSRMLPIGLGRATRPSASCSYSPRSTSG